MWDSLAVGITLCVCSFFIGRKLYRQFKAATNPAAGFECGCGCSGGCGVSVCPEKKRVKNGVSPR